MHIVFYSTSDVFKAEEILNGENIECKVVPTPVQDKAYCGVCIWTESRAVQKMLDCIEYEIID